MSDTSDDTPDTIDVTEELSEAVEELQPPDDLQEEDLFAVDALGDEPAVDAPYSDHFQLHLREMGMCVRYIYIRSFARDLHFLITK